ncbi:MAG: hypothetical protein WC054_00440 [Candidatus Nanopelagicales bacterium]
MGGDLGHAPTDVMSWGPNDPPITIEQMIEREKLVTLEQGREILGKTEPLAYVNFDTGPHVRFRVEDDWNQDLGAIHGTEPVNAFVTFMDGMNDGTEYQLSLDGLHGAAKQFSMGKGLVERVPGHLTEDMLNYHFRTGMDKSLQLMVIGEDQLGSAFTSDSVQPFSNLALLDRALEVIERVHPGVSVYVDRNKISHSLLLTHLQLVLPDVARLIEGTNEVDDRWWGGLQLTNSLTASKQTEIAAFMFRQRCTNGYIDVLPDGGVWNRRTSGQELEPLLAWAGQAVEDALGHFDGIFERVQQLVHLRIDPNNVGATATDLFEQYRIPTAARTRIMNNLVENDQLTMYALTNAVTQAANNAASTAEQQRLMRSGGDVIRHAERCGGCHRVLPEGVDGHAH